MDSFQASNSSMFDNYSFNQVHLSNQGFSSNLTNFEDTNQDEFWQLRLPSRSFIDCDYAHVGHQHQYKFKVPSSL